MHGFAELWPFARLCVLGDRIDFYCFFFLQEKLDLLLG